MTDQTQTIAELKAEVEAMKAARVEELTAQAEERKQNEEVAELQRQLESLKAGVIPQTAPQTPPGASVGAPGVGLNPTEADVKQAAVRQVLCGFSHAFFGPVASVYYGVKTNNFIPVAAATGIAVVSVPLAIVDFGLTLALAPPITSALLVITNSQEKRRRLGITMPEQADAMLMKFRSF